MYATVLLALSVVCTSAIANSAVYTSIIEAIALDKSSEKKKSTLSQGTLDILSNKAARNGADLATGISSAPMFMSIVQNSDEEVFCSVDGSFMAKFFLCGTNDDRNVTVSQSGTVEWQQQLGSCSLVGTDNCPVIDPSCWPSTGGSTFTGNSFPLDASDPDVAGEYRVRVNGGAWFYFRVTSNPVSPNLVKTDIICGNPGRVEINNLPAGYVYTIGDPADNTGYQANPDFPITTPGTYQVHAKLDGASASSCIFPSNTVTVNELDIRVEVSRTDITCDGEFGSISVEIFDVPEFYSFRLIKDGSTFNTAGPKAGSTQTWSNLGPGTYMVDVSAAGSCTALVDTIDEGSGPVPITIGDGVSPIDAAAYATDSFGCGATSVPVFLEASGGTAPYSYSVDGAPFTGSFTDNVTFDVSTFGTYNIIVRDAGGCTKDAAVDVENLPAPVVNYTVTDAACGSTNNGSIVANVVNSNGYTLTFSNDGGATFQNSTTFANLAPGPYNMVVRYEQDSFVCTLPNPDPPVNDPPRIETVGTPSTISSTATGNSTPSCANETGGEITFTPATGGVGPYSYSIGSGFVAGQTVFSNLPIGTYNTQVRDQNGCVADAGQVVFAALDKPTDIDFAEIALDCSTNSATVQLTPTSTNPIVNYSIISPSVVDNGGSDTFAGLTVGSYVFQITDDEGCSYEESYTVDNISSIRVSAQTLSEVICVGESNGTGRFVVDGFAGTYNYQIDANPVVTNQTDNLISLTGLTAGSYTITVTDNDTNCVDSATLTIAEPSAPLSLNPIYTEMSCQNNNRGAINANASGGWGGNRYSLVRADGSIIAGPRSNPNFTGLTSTTETYFVRVEDNLGCVVTSSPGKTFTALEFPTISLGTSDFCFDSTDAASLSVVATGGDGIYEYRINGGPWGPSPSFSGLAPDTYTIEVRDGNECPASITRTIEPQLTTNITIVRELECTLTGTRDARIRVNISDGYTPYLNYEVSFNGAPYSGTTAITGNSFVFDTPNDGTYQFRVSDSGTDGSGASCTTETNEVVIAPIESIVASAVPTDPRCGDPNTGVVELVPDTSVGIPPYEYSTDNVNYGSQPIFGNLAPGNYTYYVRDSRGCFVPVPFTIGPAGPPLDATVAITDATCSPGGTFGEIDVTGITDGTAPFTYTVLDAAGAVFATVGPTPATTANFPNVPEGTYTVVVTDDLGCEDRENVIIDNDLNLDLVPVTTTTPPDCSTDPVYIVDIVELPALDPPYQIGLLGGPLTAPNVDVDTHDFTGQIQPGVTYFVEVINASGCRYVEEIAPITGPSLGVTATGTETSCDISGNGTVSYTVSGASGATVEVTLVNTDTGAVIAGPNTVPAAGPFPDFNNLPPGNYQVLVEDLTSDCDGGAVATVIQDIPTVAIDVNSSASCTDPLGRLVVRGIGGTPAYTFAIVTANDPAPGAGAYSTDTSYDLAPGTYDVYIQDSATGRTCGSVLEDVVIDTEGGVGTPTIDVINQCVAVSSYSINVTAPLTTGPAPETTFEYDIGGNGFQTSPNFTVANPGTYVITVRDGNGCEGTVIAEVFDFFSIDLSAGSEPSCDNASGRILVNTDGGSGNFRYTLSQGGIPFPPVDAGPDYIFTGIAPGNYDIEVEDLGSNTTPNCTDTATVEVATLTTPVIDTTVETTVSCNGGVGGSGTDGSILVTIDPASAVDGPFTYNLYNAGGILITSQVEDLFEDLSPGAYQVGISSEFSCESARRTVVVPEPTTSLSMDWEASPYACDTSNSTFNTTTITVFTDSNLDGSGTPTGTAPYSYSLLIAGDPTYDGTSFQSTNTFEVIDNGSVQDATVIVRDANGCELTVQRDIDPPSNLTFDFALTKPLTCDATGSGTDPATLEVIVLEGPGNYTIHLLPFSTGVSFSTGGTDRATFPLSTPGDYIFAVSDDSNGGCFYVTQPYTLDDFNDIEAVIAEVTPVTCYLGTDGVISLEVNNYVGRYRAEVFTVDAAGVETTTGRVEDFDTAAPINTPELIDNVPGGNLVVRVEALDSPFCDTRSNIVTVRQPNEALTIDARQTASVTCFIPGRGEITATNEGGWGNYVYRLEMFNITSGAFEAYVPYDSFGPDNRFIGLSEGRYRVFVEDDRGCPIDQEVTLDLPTAITADIEVVQPLLCPGDNNGVIRAFNVTGGEDDNGDGEEYLYQLNRIDNDGNTIGDPDALQESPVFSNLSAGNYSITIFDGWDCNGVTLVETIQDPEPLRVDIAEVTPPGCGDSAALRLTVESHVVGSGMDYSYRRLGDTGPFTDFRAAGDTSPDVNSVVITIPDVTTDPSPYRYEVQNSNGCPPVPSPELVMEKALPLVLIPDLVDANIKCEGEATGIIRTQGYNAIGQYRYTLVNNDLGSNVDSPTGPYNDPAIPTPADIVQGTNDTGIFRNLGPGIYWVYGQSGACSAITEQIEILPKDPLVVLRAEPAPISCFGLEDGTITIEAEGGTGTIRFSISETLSEFYEGTDPANPNLIVFRDLPPGDYEVNIVDELGCTQRRDVTVPDVEELVVSDPIVTDEICLGANDGTINIPIDGGTPLIDALGVEYYEIKIEKVFPDNEESDTTPYFDYYPGEVLTDNQGTAFITEHEYLISVRDANGCPDFGAFRIESGVLLDHFIDPQYSCSGNVPNSSVSVEMIDESVLPRVTFYLEDINAIAPEILLLPEDQQNAERRLLATGERAWSNLPPGSYQVYLFHENGCSELSEVFEIEMYENLEVVLETTGPNQVTATATGGFGTYEYFFQGVSQGTDNIFLSNEDASVTVRVVDELGCEVSAAIEFTFTGMLEIPNFFTPNNDLENDEWEIGNREFFPNIEVKIYDRYGRVVAILDQVKNWDGTYEGKELPSGDYWYVVNQNGQDNTQFVGHFTLYR